jgi:hypothetical protein
MRRWWTGEDSNLRSPQGAADLQSAGFSHSPTRPAKRARDTAVVSRKPNQNCTGLLYGALRNAERARVWTHQPCSLFSRGIRPYTRPLNPGPLKLSWRRELNPRPSDYKSDALPTELRQPCANRANISQRQSNCKQVSPPPAKPLPACHLSWLIQFPGCPIVQRAWQIRNHSSLRCDALR